jgi:hypothetical protein
VQHQGWLASPRRLSAKHPLTRQQPLTTDIRRPAIRQHAPPANDRYRSPLLRAPQRLEAPTERLVRRRRVAGMAEHAKN